MSLIAKIEQFLEVLKNLEARAQKGILPDKEGSDTAGSILLEMNTLFDKDYAAHHMHKRFIADTMWWSPSKNGYANDGDIKNFIKIQNHILNLINELQPSFIKGKIEEQYYFSDGQAYEAKKKVFEILSRASNNLVIIDKFLDDTIFDYITSLATTVDIQLLTGTTKPIFKPLYYALKANRPNIEARECVNCHDRFIIIDGKEIWQLGASINHLGESASMINKVEPASGRFVQFMNDFNNWWTIGNNI